jgi:hypothetical protein
MKKIIVTNKDGSPVEIDAGISKYEELSSAPILNTFKDVVLKDSMVALVDSALVITPSVSHAWSEDELALFCNNATDGTYNILTERFGNELLIIDSTNEVIGKRFRRITVDQDLIYDKEAGWITISDTSSRKLVFSITNEAEIPASMVVGNALVLNCYYYSTIGAGTITILRGSTTVATVALTSGQNKTISLTNYIADGENAFTYTVTNNGTGVDEKTLHNSFTITGIKLSYTPTFNKLSKHSGDVSFNFNYTGTGLKKVSFSITNADGVITDYTSADSYKDAGSATIVLSSALFSHGINTITTYMYMNDSSGALLTKTDPLSYEFPYFLTNDSTPIVMTYYDFSAIQEWDSIAIPYYIWAGETQSAIKFELTFAQTDDKGLTTTKVWTQEYDNTNAAYLNNYLTANAEHSWQISNVPHGSLTFRIYLKNTTDTEYKQYYEKTGVEVAASSWDLNPVSAGILFGFSPLDRPDTKAFDTWTNNGYSMNVSGLNWITDGLQTDKTSGDKSLLFANAASATIDNIDLFTLAKTNGFTFELDYKVDSSADDAKPIFTYTNASNHDGILIYPTKVVINYNQNTASTTNDIVVNFQKGERKNIAFTIEPENSIAKYVYVKVYVDGILSYLKDYPTSASFVNCTSMKFNTNSNQFNLYAVRAYSAPLSSRQVLQNYISNFGSTDTKLEKLTFNNIYNNNALTDDNNTTTFSGEYVVDFEKTRKIIPTMCIVMPTLPVDKTYNSCKILYWEKYQTTSPFITYNKNSFPASCKIQAQGTSSLEYPRKNFKIKFPEKIALKGRGKDDAEKNFTFKADYMDSSGADNIGNAQVMQNGLIPVDWDGTPVYDPSHPDSTAKRITLDGFPIAVFHATSITADNLPADPVFIGTYNWNYDKKSKNLLGWSGTFQGFEFRSNTSSTCLQKGIPCLTSFENESEGFEWRWTGLSDWIDDYHDGNLTITMDGGYFDDDVQQKYSEAEYLARRFSDNPIINLRPFNYFYIKDNSGNINKLYIKNDDGSYAPFDYRSITSDLDVFALEFGVKIAEKDGVTSVVYQKPYGMDAQHPCGQLYADGEGYYKYTRNTDHCAYFNYNDSESYFTDIANWTALKPVSSFYWPTYTYTAGTVGTYDSNSYILDPTDNMHHLLSNYKKYKAVSTTTESGTTTTYEEDTAGTYIQVKATSYIDYTTLTPYTLATTWTALTSADTILTYDLMREIYQNWYYAVDTLSHCNDENYKALMDSTQTYSDTLGNNGNGLFKKSALLDYFCLSLITGVCDNFTKNLMIHSYDGGKTWVPSWYDMDTCYGLNNSGSYVFDYDIDFKDAGVFNGSNATLWDKFYRLCYSDIQDKYREIRKTHISADSIMDVLYNQNIAYKCESLYNNSALYRYLIPHFDAMSGTKLDAAQGSRLSLLKYWTSNRETFLDSKYYSDTYSEDRVVFRMYSPKTVQFNLSADTKMKLGLSFDSPNASVPEIQSDKLKVGQIWTYDYIVSTPLTDKNTYIYGASHLLDLGDISGTVAKVVDLTKCTKVRSIILGTDDADLLARYEEVIGTQKQALTLPQGICNNLTKIDLHNCNHLADTTLTLVSRNAGVITNNTPALQILNIAGSNINTIDMGDYTPIQTLNYSDYITNVKLTNLLQLETVTFGDISNVKNIDMENTPKFNQLALLTKFVNIPLTSITADNLQGTKATSVTTDFMDWLYNENAVLGGIVYVQNIADSNLEEYRTKWPKLTVELDQIYPKDVVFGAQGYGNADPALTHVMGAEGFTSGIGHASDMTIADNDFDAAAPWSIIDNITDANGNQWVRIYKFYQYYSSDGTIEVSQYKINDQWFLNPVFTNSDGTERAYIDIAKYLSHVENGIATSKSGETATKGLTPAVMRTSAYANNGSASLYTYGIFDIWTMILLQDLYSIEFATTNTGAVLPGYYGSNPTSITNGATDAILSSSGVVTDYSVSKARSSMKYRGLENIVGVTQFVDGALLNYGTLQYNSDLSAVINSGDDALTKVLSYTLSSSAGVVKTLGFDTDSKIRLPITVDSTDDVTKYYCGEYDADPSGKRRIYFGAQGLWNILITAGSTATVTNGYFRMIRLPK